MADGQANEIRAFDAQGPFLRKMGRSGGGPGDTVAAYDCMAGRLSFFGPGDAFARDVFDAEGRLLGAVAKPTGLRVTQIGADFIVGTWRDELEVPHVRVYRLEKWAAR